MLSGQNTAITDNLAGLVDKAGAKITHAIQSAAHKTGVDFSYLMKQAQVESSFKADAKAKTSSATGLYQFIDSTWLSMVNKYGDKHGLSHLADKISDGGKVASASVKKQILELRENPELCSMMAAEMAADNKDYLESCTGKTAGATELYMAHFMGAGGAAKFLNALDDNPSANAARLFPDAASANKNIFYDKAGKARSVEDVYALFQSKFSTVEKVVDTAPLTTATVSDIPKEDITWFDNSETANVMAAMVPRSAPLYHSLFTNAQPSGIPPEAINTTSYMPKSFFAMLSPVDVLELLKMSPSDSKDNTAARG